MGPSFERPVPRRVGEKKIRPEEPDDHALGRSQGGFGTKIHLLTDGDGSPLAAIVGPGQMHEVRGVEPVLELASQSTVLAGITPEYLAGDKGYGGRTVRGVLEERGIVGVIPTRERDWKIRDPDFPFHLYRRRTKIECTIGWLKEFRRIATRFEKLAVSFCAILTVSFIAHALRRLSRASAFSDRA